jgi:single-strand DNA-binding protein
MKTVNKATIMGYVGQPPNLSHMKNGEAFVNFSIATSTKFTSKQTGEVVENVEWHNCAAYGKLAEIIGQYVTKGSKLYVEGKLKTNKYTGKDGIERYATQITVNEMSMLSDKSDDAPRETHNASERVKSPPPPPADFDDDIPF